MLVAGGGIEPPTLGLWIMNPPLHIPPSKESITHFPPKSSRLSRTWRTPMHIGQGRLQQLYNKTHLPKRESACTLHNGFKSAAPRIT